MTNYQDILRAHKIDVSRETADKLTAFEQVFHKWSKTINLIAPSTKPNFIQRHLLDSVQLLPLLKGRGPIVDLGSGGGFPGIVLAILMAEQGRKVHLVESNHKKAAFLRTALHECGVAGEVHALRIDASYDVVGPVEWVVARALAPLEQLFKWSEPWINLSTDLPVKMLFPKGRNVAEEIAQAHRGFAFDLIQHRSIIDSESCILEISQLKRGSE